MANKNTTYKDIPEIKNLAKMVDYQTGAVVSKTLMNPKNGTVTLFAFAAGQALSEHTAPFDALVHLVDGAADITIAGNIYHLQSGQMIIMPANAPHALKAVQPFKMLLVMIKN